MNTRLTVRLSSRRSLVGGVNGGLDLTLAVFDSVQESVAEVGTVEGELVAQEVEGIAEERVALLGHLAVDDGVAGDVDGGVHTSFSPQLIGEQDVGDVTDGGEIAGHQVGAGAWDGEEVAGDSGGE